ncbi:hypothetical protein BDZ45DRAFT_797992 [Acephala macrosclerotiorum]|nr:hypothetical protein BDZ45DRAFT_797992 [Acephala macrosclerotiorum]
MSFALLTMLFAYRVSWDQTLDEKAPPPSYTVSQNEAAPQIQQQTQLKLTLPQNRTSSPRPSPGPQQTVRFPPSFGIYHASGSISDLIIAQSKDDPHPLYYISTHSGFSSQPSVILHSSPNPNSPPLADADFHSFSNTIDMPSSSPSRLVQDPKQQPWKPPAPLVMSGNSAPQSPQPPPSKSSNGKTVPALKSKLSKADRMGRNAYDKKGKMAFVGSGLGLGLGEGWEVMCVMSIAAIMEKERRAQNNRRRNSGAGGFGGAGGGLH